MSDTGRGIRRKRVGTGFSYVGLDGKPIRDAAELERIRSLGIPPAWTDVWICPVANGHLQATGRDVKGREQYRYHARWREVRDETKYERMLSFAEALPRIRARTEADLALSGLPRNKVLATVVKLLERTHIRIGNEEYAQQNESFGLTTLRDHHVEIDGPTLRFRSWGKSGKEHDVGMTDKRLARIVQRWVLEACLDGVVANGGPAERDGVQEVNALRGEEGRLVRMLQKLAHAADNVAIGTPAA